MINCVGCGKNLYTMEDVRNAKNVGFALYGECKHCGVKQSVASLWRRTKVEKYVELPKERKKRKP